MSFEIHAQAQDVMRLCRICETTKNLLDISNSVYRHLDEKLNSIGDFKVKYSTFLRFICTPCSLKLKEAFLFKTQCEQTYRKLVAQIDAKFLFDPLATDPLQITNSPDDLGDDITFKEEEVIYPDKVEIIQNLGSYNEDKGDLGQTYKDSDDTILQIEHKEDEEMHESERKTIFGPLPTESAAEQAMLDKFDTVFAMEEKIIKGKKINKGDKLYICRLCPKVFVMKSFCVRHIHIVHDNQQEYKSGYKCPYCPVNLKTKSDHKFHMESHVIENLPKKCAVKEKDQERIDDKAQKPKNDHKKIVLELESRVMPVFRCEFCGYYASSKPILEQHKLIHPEAKNYKCDQCDESFTQREELISHRKIHLKKSSELSQEESDESDQGEPKSNKKPRIVAKYTCAICEKKVTSKFIMKAHMERIHLKLKPIQCESCESKFYNKTSLRAHVKVHHQTLCELCGQSNRCVHRRKPREPAPYESHPFLCHLCGQRSATKCGHIEHQRIHSDIRSFECKECGKSFKQRTGLIIHRRIHMDVKPYPCKICSKTFIASYYLKRHMTSHTKEKAYSCQICEKKFTSPAALPLHMSTHTGIRVQCEYCLKNFPIMKALRHHQKWYCKAHPQYQSNPKKPQKKCKQSDLKENTNESLKQKDDSLET